ncbi:MAG: hypothetical protein WAQ51_18600 [Candidatus Microthrix parvicella]|jgi:hypothetical protein|nr:hypothetical protein [Candidatus Microthrix sp.]MBK7021551.1 hypothetical protein [Candidatus Microthrix sp.]
MGTKIMREEYDDGSHLTVNEADDADHVGKTYQSYTDENGVKDTVIVDSFPEG